MTCGDRHNRIEHEGRLMEGLRVTRPDRMHSSGMRTVLMMVVLAFASPGYCQRVAHVLVALCDNEHQGIVKVPPGIGNGQNARTNLYWGAGYGVKTHFDRAEEWKRVPCSPPTEPHILDRAVWQHRDSAVYIVAEAYDGRNIREATVDLLRYASGNAPKAVAAGGTALRAGGAAQLLAYVGHDGLMDFSIEERFPGPAGNRREAIILACISKRPGTPRP
jgi:hypothetical protein